MKISTIYDWALVALIASLMTSAINSWAGEAPECTTPPPPPIPEFIDAVCTERHISTRTFYTCVDRGGNVFHIQKPKVDLL